MKFTVLRIAAAAALSALILTSCSLNPSVDGDELIKKAREEYKALDSAKVIMTNTETGEIEQTFTFKYDEKDILMYSYEGKSENSEYAQFNNCLLYTSPSPRDTR